MARSFATSAKWHENLGIEPDVGIVLRLANSVVAGNVLLVPPAQTARWFERRIRDMLLAKTAGDRRREREVVICGLVFPTVVEEVIALTK